MIPSNTHTQVIFLHTNKEVCAMDLAEWCQERVFELIT
jgi:hypothetical protein